MAVRSSMTSNGDSTSPTNGIHESSLQSVHGGPSLLHSSRHKPDHRNSSGVLSVPLLSSYRNDNSAGSVENYLQPICRLPLDCWWSIYIHSGVCDSPHFIFTPDSPLKNTASTCHKLRHVLWPLVFRHLRLTGDPYIYKTLAKCLRVLPRPLVKATARSLCFWSFVDILSVDPDSEQSQNVPYNPPRLQGFTYLAQLSLRDTCISQSVVEDILGIPCLRRLVLESCWFDGAVKPPTHYRQKLRQLTVTGDDPSIPESFFEVVLWSPLEVIIVSGQGLGDKLYRAMRHCGLLRTLTHLQIEDPHFIVDPTHAFAFLLPGLEVLDIGRCIPRGYRFPLPPAAYSSLVHLAINHWWLPALLDEVEVRSLQITHSSGRECDFASPRVLFDVEHHAHFTHMTELRALFTSLPLELWRFLSEHCLSLESLRLLSQSPDTIKTITMHLDRHPLPTSLKRFSVTVYCSQEKHLGAEPLVKENTDVSFRELFTGMQHHRHLVLVVYGVFAPQAGAFFVHDNNIHGALNSTHLSKISHDALDNCEFLTWEMSMLRSSPSYLTCEDAHGRYMSCELGRKLERVVDGRTSWWKRKIAETKGN